MSNRRVRVVLGVAIVAVLVGAAAVTIRGAAAGHERSNAARSREAAAALPAGLTPIDRDHPNPTGNDPSVVGKAPKPSRPTSAKAFLDRARQVRDSAARADAAAPSKAQPGAPAPGAPKPQADPNSLLVRFDKGTSAATVTATLAKAGVTGRPLPHTRYVAV